MQGLIDVNTLYSIMYSAAKGKDENRLLLRKCEVSLEVAVKICTTLAA